MSRTAAPLIDYAMDHAESPADRLLRRIVAWTAIVTAAESVISTALLVALSRNWLASPPNMSWSMGGPWEQAATAAGMLAMCGLILGGVLLLGRSRASILLIRGGVALSIVITLVEIALNLYSSPTYTSYWSKPGSAAMEAMHYFHGLFLALLMLLLTLPPLARRMV